MPAEAAEALARAYVFLRRVEHRIQYLDDQQTHLLPTRDDDLAWMARTMGYPDLCAFLHELDGHREAGGRAVRPAAGRPEPCKACGKLRPGPPASPRPTKAPT
jgi:glutamate-ammonia-ligase adenylyltransferase